MIAEPLTMCQIILRIVLGKVLFKIGRLEIFRKNSKKLGCGLEFRFKSSQNLDVNSRTLRRKAFYCNKSLVMVQFMAIPNRRLTP
jgi:hypothetical protein